MLFSKGAEWRRWDLHIHTKDTFKNDQFTSSDFVSFCNVLFKKALQYNIAVIGITDYFTIDNYKKVLNYIDDLKDNQNFTGPEKERIQSIFILPNVELRVLPVTDSGRMVNFHCIFNPAYIGNLDDDFFNDLHMAIGDEVYYMNASGLRKLGLSKGADETNAINKGIESFVVSPDSLVKLFKNKPILRKNTITIVSNSNKDGNSAYQKHYDFFEEVDKKSLESIRKSIYHLSNLIFSSNQGDREYFLGKKKDREGKIIDDEKVVISKCGSLKGCVHGSDAHTEDKLFTPDDDAYCWVKANPTFEGLKQLLIEPDDRIYIGKTPAIHIKVQDNRTKYIKSVTVNSIEGYDGKYGKWFNKVNIPLNSELVAIIGNKGSGKSAISDILALCGSYKNQSDFSFLIKSKFRDGKHAKNFEATMTWESDTTNTKVLSDEKADGEVELVKYLPQGYFEKLTNEISSTEAFQKEIENVVFTHLEEDDKIGYQSFEELMDAKKKSVEKDITVLKDQINEINKSIIRLEQKLNSKYKREIENRLKLKKDELIALIEPLEVKNPNEDTNLSEQNTAKLQLIQQLKDRVVQLETEITECINEKQNLLIQLRDLKEFKREVEFKITDIEQFRANNRPLCEKYGLSIDQIFSIQSDLTPIVEMIEAKEAALQNAKVRLGEEPPVAPEYRSLKKQLDEIKQHLIKEQNTLDLPQKAYQVYLSEKRSWEEKKNKITGSETIPETIKYYEAELEYMKEKLLADIEALRIRRYEETSKIFDKKKAIIAVYKEVKQKLDSIINNNTDLLNEYKIDIKATLSLSPMFPEQFFRNINQNVVGTFYSIEGGNVELKKLIQEVDFDTKEGIEVFLERINTAIHTDQRERYNKERRFLDEQVKNPLELYNYIYNLEFLEYNYQLMQGSKTLQQLSPGERGALLLVFYLLLDKSDIPLIIDQPEDNLDNNSVAHILVPFIRKAKSKRQIIMVTHNPNLAVVSDAEQVIYVQLDKDKENAFTFISGSIEDRKVNECIVKVLEGAMPAFNKRKLKYYE